MKVNFKQEQFLEFVKQEHGEQKRKYTGEPYWYHCYTVADIVAKYDETAIEIAFGHDLLEDTDCSDSKLEAALLSIGYDLLNTDFIVGGIVDLTDIYTADNYPELNRKKRKELEAKRLGTIHPVSQTVKYADLIHNTSSIVKYDPGFAKIYLKEKQEILKYMRAGNKNLLRRCESTLQNCINLID